MTPDQDGRGAALTAWPAGRRRGLAGLVDDVDALLVEVERELEAARAVRSSARARARLRWGASGWGTVPVATGDRAPGQEVRSTGASPGFMLDRPELPWDGRCVCRGGDALPCRYPTWRCGLTTVELVDRILQNARPPADDSGHGTHRPPGGPDGPGGAREGDRRRGPRRP